MSLTPGRRIETHDWLFSARRVLVAACLTLGIVGVAHAQSVVDPRFDPGTDGVVRAVAAQADGKVLVGGFFTTLGGGGTGTVTRNRIGRLNQDGSLDTTFDPGANGAVYALVVQPDGKILVGGAFTMLGGGGTGTTARSNIARLNSDGSVDMSFNPGSDNPVYALAVQADGKILVGGAFTEIGSGGPGVVPPSHLGRLNADGSLDSTFYPGANDSVQVIRVQPDGKILIGGLFTTLGTGAPVPVPPKYVGRLNTDGSFDTSFDPGANGAVYALAVQPDGRILIGGFFTTLDDGSTGPLARNHLGRLNPDGSIDTSFDPGTDGTVYGIALQADGRILASGLFNTLGGGGTGTTARGNIGRLNPEGSLDATFDPGTDGAVFALAAPPDGKILVGGFFSTLGGGGSGNTARSRIGRVLTNIPNIDLDGDARGDVFTYDPTSGAWNLEKATPAGGWTTVSGSWLPGWDVEVARFNADALADVFLSNPTTGQWYRMVNTGSGFTQQATGAWWPDWQKFVLDLDGDGLSDLFLYDPLTGVWYKCLSTSTGFTYYRGRWITGWEITPMNLNGDAADDLFLFDRTTGRWFWVLSQAGGSFTYPESRYWTPDWDFYPADFNGDGLGDVFLYRPAAGQYYVALNVGTGYTYTYGGGWAADWTPAVLDLDADLKTDLFLYNKSTGRWFEMLGDGAGHFSVGAYGYWSTGWDLYPTEFNRDARMDLFVYNPATGLSCQAFNLALGPFSEFCSFWGTGWTVMAGPLRR